jgi:hypothetical protein
VVVRRLDLLAPLLCLLLAARAEAVPSHQATLYGYLSSLADDGMDSDGHITSQRRIVGKGPDELLAALCPYFAAKAGHGADADERLLDAQRALCAENHADNIRECNQEEVVAATARAHQALRHGCPGLQRAEADPPRPLRTPPKRPRRRSHHLRRKRPRA